MHIQGMAGHRRILHLFTVLILLLSVIIFFSPHSALESEGSPSIEYTRSTVGRVFYIDNVNGDDSYDGLSMEATTPGTGPWKTLAYLDKDMDFEPGDQILLRSGQEWDLRDEEDGFLQIRSGGAKGAPLVVSSYGEGSRPCLNGHYPAAGESSGDTIEINGDYVTLKGIEIKNTWSFGIVSQSIRSKHYGVTIEDCHIHDVGRDGIYTPFGEYELTITNNRIERTGLRVGGAGIAVMGDGTHHGNDIEISYNRIIVPQGDGITLHEGSSTRETHLGRNIYVHHNEVNGSLNGDAIDLTTGSNVYVYNNIAYDCNNQLIHVDSSFHDGYIFNNILWGDAATGLAYIAVSNITFFNNVLMVNGGDTPYCLNINSDNYHSLPVENITVYRNTFVYDDTMSHPGLIEIADELGTLGRISFLSNIITSSVAGVPDHLLHFQFHSYRADDPDFLCDGNVYGPGEFSIRDRDDDVNWDTWQDDYGHDENGFAQDPGLIWGEGGQYQMENGSICLGNGIYMPFPPSIRNLIPVYGDGEIGALEDFPDLDMRSDHGRIVENNKLSIYDDGLFDESASDGPSSDLHLSVAPDIGWRDGHFPSLEVIEIEFTQVEIGEGFHVIWTEKDQRGYPFLRYTIGGLFPFTKASIIIDGNTIGEFISDKDGFIHFNRTGSGDHFTLELISNMIMIKEDISDLNATTGDIFQFKATIGEKGRSSEYIIEYWMGSQGPNNKTIKDLDMDSNENIVSYSINIPTGMTGQLRYNFLIVDPEDNRYRSSVKVKEIIDNDMPDVGKRRISRGDDREGYILEIEAGDNIGIDEVFIEYILEEVVYNISMNRSGDSYSHFVPIDDINGFKYTIIVSDSSKNTVIFGPYVVHDDRNGDRGLFGIKKDSWLGRNIISVTIIILLILVIISLLYALQRQKHKYRTMLSIQE